MKEDQDQLYRVCQLQPFRRFLARVGKSETTGWRWRRDGIVRTINICGKLYIAEDEISRFETRAKNGEFTKVLAPPKERGNQ